jgi:drug/metabolite transporter (DMT)-like permease
MRLHHSIGLTLFAFVLATGQIMFKYVAIRVPPFSRLADIGQLFLEPLFWSSVTLYGAATILWIYLLQQVPLSRAYPFVALGFLIVPVAASAIFGDNLPIRYFLGSVLIAFGVYLTAWAPS